MEYTNYFKTDMMHRCRLTMEIMNTAPMVQQMYDDICLTLGCFKPALTIRQYGVLIDNGNGGRWCRGGLFTPFGGIIVALVDIYVTAYDAGRKLHITDMDVLYKAAVAHTLIHELSHSMQNIYCDNEMINAMEWANEKYMWDVLVPIVSPMLKKKYKIKLTEETIDESVGRVYTCKYNSLPEIELALYPFITAEYDLADSYRMVKTITAAENLTVNIEFFGKSYTFDLIKNYAVDDNAVNGLRAICTNPAKAVRFKFSLTDLRRDGKNLVINILIGDIAQEIFFNLDSDDYSNALGGGFDRA